MKYGIREICDVVLKAKANQKLGNKIFYKGEPVLYFDTLKTSTMEGAATTVYAQGGRGNSRLVAWEGERTVTFTMEDALISPIGFSILSGAGLVDAGKGKESIKVHTTETTDDVEVTATGTYGEKDYKVTEVTIALNKKPYSAESTYVMVLMNGEVVSEPYIPTAFAEGGIEANSDGKYEITLNAEKDNLNGLVGEGDEAVQVWPGFKNELTVLVDYYTEMEKGVQQIEITPDKFGGNYYLEASTLFRTTDGVDVPAEFIIPNCKIQSNFTFTMASSGDPSTFTFTMDAFPDYLRFDNSKKVLAAIQILDTTNAGAEAARHMTKSQDTVDELTGAIVEADKPKA